MTVKRKGICTTNFKTYLFSAIILISSLALVSPAHAVQGMAGEAAIQVYLEDSPISFTVPPQVIGGRVMVPMRPIFEAMGANLEWDSATQTATAVKGATSVITQIGSNIATINGIAQTLDVPPTAINGSTLAPLRFVAEAFGSTVRWDGESQTAYISASPVQQADANSLLVLSPDYLIPTDTTKTYVFLDEVYALGSRQVEHHWQHESDNSYRVDQHMQNSDCSGYYEIKNGYVFWKETVTISNDSVHEVLTSGENIELAPISPGQSWKRDYSTRFYNSFGTLSEMDNHITSTFLGMEEIEIMGETVNAAHIVNVYEQASSDITRKFEQWCVKGLGVVKSSSTTQRQGEDVHIEYTRQLAEIK